MSRITKKLSAGLTLFLLLGVVAGCTSDYRSSSSKPVLDNWAPKDPWANQKEGLCCFLYKDPTEEVIAAATEHDQPSRESEKTALTAKQDEIATLKRQLHAAESANSALERDRTNVSKELSATKAERAGLAAQLEAAKSEGAARTTAQEAKLERSMKSMEQILQPEIDEKTGSVRRTEDSLTVELADRILFDSGSAKISPKGLKVIKRIAETLMKDDGQIRVRGHTDNVPIRKSPPPRFLSNWELSVARAGNVVQHLEKNGIKPEQLSAAGYSSTRPAVPNENHTTRARNRRVEIVVVPAPPAETVSQRD